jgi:hypothetical protein
VKELLVSAKYQAGWALEPICVLWRKYLLPLSEIESRFLRHLAHSLVTIQTILSKLWYHICNKTNNTHTTDTTIERKMLQSRIRYFLSCKTVSQYNVSEECGCLQQNRQCTNNGTMRRIHATIVVVEKQ